MLHGAFVNSISKAPILVYQTRMQNVPDSPRPGHARQAAPTQAAVQNPGVQNVVEQVVPSLIERHPVHTFGGTAPAPDSVVIVDPGEISSPGGSTAVFMLCLHGVTGEMGDTIRSVQCESYNHSSGAQTMCSRSLRAGGHPCAGLQTLLEATPIPCELTWRICSSMLARGWECRSAGTTSVGLAGAHLMSQTSAMGLM